MVSQKGRRGGRPGLHAQGVQGRHRPVRADRSRQRRPHHARKEPGLVGQRQRRQQAAAARQDHHQADHRQQRAADQSEDWRRALRQQHRAQGRGRGQDRLDADVPGGAGPVRSAAWSPIARRASSSTRRVTSRQCPWRIDRQELLDKAFFGIGVVGYGTIAPAHFAYDANFKPFEKADPDGAKALVQAVGKGAAVVRVPGAVRRSGACCSRRS